MVYLIISSFIMSLVFSLTLYNINIIKLKYSSLIFLGIMSFITIMIIPNINEALCIPILCVLFFLYLLSNNKKIIINIITVITSVSLCLTVDMVCGYLFLNIFKVSIHQLLSDKKIYLLLQLAVLSLSFIASKLIGLIMEKLAMSQYLRKINIKVTFLILTNIITAGVIIYIFSMINKFINTSNIVVILNIILFIIYFASTLSIILLYGSYIKKDVLYKHKHQEFAQLKEYTDMLEYMHDELRKFRHDYINIISTINGYIEEKEMEKLEVYFNEKILPLSQNISNNNSNLALLKNIKVTGLKGLLSSKIVQAQSKGINTFIDIAESIEKIDMEIIDLCRIMGILFDNAIEAAVICNDAKIKLGVIMKKHSVIIVIINSCNEDIPPIYKIFEKGFSTKGDNRGLGLSNAKEIVDKNHKNSTLNTSIKNAEFIQELEIQYEGS